jgi:hypothetical protein
MAPCPARTPLVKPAPSKAGPAAVAQPRNRSPASGRSRRWCPHRPTDTDGRDRPCPWKTPRRSHRRPHRPPHRATSGPPDRDARDRESGDRVRARETREPSHGLGISARERPGSTRCSRKTGVNGAVPSGLGSTPASRCSMVVLPATTRHFTCSSATFDSASNSLSSGRMVLRATACCNRLTISGFCMHRLIRVSTLSPRRTCPFSAEAVFGSDRCPDRPT